MVVIKGGPRRRRLRLASLRRRKVRAHESAAPGNTRAVARGLGAERRQDPSGRTDSATESKLPVPVGIEGRGDLGCPSMLVPLRFVRIALSIREAREACFLRRVRVKRRGKSPPRRRRRRRHGKPRCEQDRAMEGAPPRDALRDIAPRIPKGIRARRLGGISRNPWVGRADPAGDRRTRWMAAAPRGVQNPAYRPAFFFRCSGTRPSSPVH